MVERVGTRGNVIDYSVLASKGRGTDNKLTNKAKIQEMSMEEKYKSPSVKKTNKKGEGLNESKIKAGETNIGHVNVERNKDGIQSQGKNKMAAKAASSFEDDKIIFQKHI